MLAMPPSRTLSIMQFANRSSRHSTSTSGAPHTSVGTPPGGPSLHRSSRHNSSASSLPAVSSLHAWQSSARQLLIAGSGARGAAGDAGTGSPPPSMPHSAFSQTGAVPAQLAGAAVPPQLLYSLGSGQGRSSRLSGSGRATPTDSRSYSTGLVVLPSAWDAETSGRPSPSQEAARPGAGLGLGRCPSAGLPAFASGPHASHTFSHTRSSSGHALALALCPSVSSSPVAAPTAAHPAAAAAAAAVTTGGVITRGTSLMTSCSGGLLGSMGGLGLGPSMMDTQGSCVSVPEHQSLCFDETSASPPPPPQPQLLQYGQGPSAQPDHHLCLPHTPGCGCHLCLAHGPLPSPGVPVTGFYTSAAADAAPIQRPLRESDGNAARAVGLVGLERAQETGVDGVGDGMDSVGDAFLIYRYREPDGAGPGSGFAAQGTLQNRWPAAAPAAPPADTGSEGRATVTIALAADSSEGTLPDQAAQVVAGLEPLLDAELAMYARGVGHGHHHGVAGAGAALSGLGKVSGRTVAACSCQVASAHLPLHATASSSLSDLPSIRGFSSALGSMGAATRATATAAAAAAAPNAADEGTAAAAATAHAAVRDVDAADGSFMAGRRVEELAAPRGSSGGGLLEIGRAHV